MKTVEEIIKEVCIYETEVTHKECIEIAELFALEYYNEKIKNEGNTAN